MAYILILEDEADLAGLYRMSLERRGHRISGIFDDPRDALAAGGEAPDLVLLDERLGGLSGTSFLPELRRVWPGARVLLATADPEVAARAAELGADEVQRKPFSVRQLIDRIEELVASAR